MSRFQPNAKAGVRILVGTQFPGGATCLYPVVRELRRRRDVDVQVIGRGHGAEFFRHHEIAFTDLTDLGGDRPTAAAVPDVIEQFRPDLIMTGVFGAAEGGLDHWLLQVARRRRIRSLGVLDAWMNYARRFADVARDDPIAYLPDRLAVMDEQTADELTLDGIPRDRVRVTGHPFLHEVRQRSDDPQASLRHRRHLGVGPSERVMAFFSEPIRWSKQQGLSTAVGYDESDAFDLLTAAIARSPRHNVLVVREHPRHMSLTWPDHIHRTRVITDSGANALDLIQAADVVVGMSSTVLVYAYLMGRTVLVLQPGLRPERDGNMLTRRGILPNLQTVDQVRGMLEDPLRSASKRLDAVRRALEWESRPDVRTAECALQLCGEPRDGLLEPAATSSSVG